LKDSKQPRHQAPFDRLERRKAEGIDPDSEALGSTAEVELARQRVQLGIDEAECRKAHAAAAIVEAEAACIEHVAETLGHGALEAKHRADMEPERQAMRLKERNTSRVIAVAVTIFAMGILTVGAVFDPWFVPTGTVVGGLAYLTHRWRISKGSPFGQETQATDERPPAQYPVG
jgi:hypothetical protein